MSRSGALRFAQYAYPPNELGYCGPDGSGVMLDPEAAAEIERRARQFEGAWSYLELIAESAGLPDPLDVAVVDAYWVGNALLERVDPGALVSRLEDRFRGQVGGTWREAADRAVAHHSFQVFEVYPWAGLLRAGRPPGPAATVLDRCRIRVGRVVAVHGEDATVECRPLAWDGATLRESGPVTETVRWSVDGGSLIAAPHVGDTVALHWDWVCEVLTAERAGRIEDLELRRLRAVRLSPVAPPAPGGTPPGRRAAWRR